MATVKLKRSATPGAVPTTAQLDLGEVAINTYDGKMYIKQDNGTASVVQVGGGGSGASMAIGTVITAPTAPSNDGTWLECNGQTLSQSTYSSLYALIGHNYLQYNVERGGQPTSMSSANTNFIIFSGTAWLYFNTTTQPQKSTDGGITWSNTAAVMPGAITANNRAVTNNNGVVMFHGNQSAAYRTTNDGASWSTVTLPTASGLTTIGVNGDTWVGITNGSAAMYYSTDAGATWNTRAGVLPVAAGTLQSRVYWNGTNWVYLFNAGSTSGMTGRSVFTGTLASGTWSAATYGTAPQLDAGSGAHTEIIEGSPQIARGGAGIYNAQYSPDSGETTKNFSVGATSSVSPLNSGPVWNGLHFMFVPTTTSQMSIMPQDGSTYYVYHPIAASGTTLNSGSPALYFGQSPSGVGVIQNGRFDASSKRMVGKMAQFVGNATTTGWYSCAMYPAINTSTSFCLPDFQYMDIPKLAGKAWMKVA